MGSTASALKANSILFVQCGKSTNVRYSGVKMAAPKFYRNLTCRKYEWNIGEAVEQEERLFDEVKTVRELTYLGDWMSAGGGCEDAATARTRCGWVMFREWSFLYC